jgi:hypothetical protein
MPGVSIYDVIGLSAAFAGALSTFVQFRRAFWVSTDGISLVTWFQFALMGIFWMGYGLAIHSWIVFSGAALCWPMQLAIITRLSPGSHRRTLFVATLTIVACCLFTTVIGGWTVGVVGTGVAMLWNRVPQIWELVRHPRDLGVSSVSWLIGAGCSVLWITYYLGASLWYPLATTAAAMCGSLTISALAAWRHRQAEGCVSVSVGPLAGRAQGLGEPLQAQAQ